MPPPFTFILTVAGMALVIFIFAAIWASRYVRIGPNRTSVSSEWRLDKGASFWGLTFAITAAMGNFFEPVARLV
jgi:hypothetical protein